MISVEIDTSGLESILDDVQKIDKNVDRGLDYSALHISRGIKMRTPVDTGKLKSSSSIRQRGRLVRDISIRGLYPHYAPDVEYGHWTRGRKSRVPGRFMVQKTYIEDSDDAVKLFEQTIFS